ncbi:MAG TPA: ABC transporter permease [Dongiaceae bacterium]|jgi:peptide/nickel transport system permease protein|nr:ABC transporter permease [Dongiaceae bacterium]
MQILRYIVARIVHALPVLIGVTIVVFLSIHLVPGDPIRIMMHGRIEDSEVAKIYHDLGMDRPLLLQYVTFLKNIFAGDLGTSLIQKAPVATLVVEKLWPTLMLLIFSTILSVLIAVPLSLVAAFKRGSWIDTGIRLGSIFGFAMPSYWIGLLLMLFFGLLLGWLPISGLGDGPVDMLRHLFMPSLTIAFFLGPILLQSLRSAMLDVLTSEHVEVARAKGLSEWRILMKHVLRNAMIPVITVLAVNISWLLSGAVVVEYVFGLPGLGSLLVRSVGYRDYPLIQGLAFVFGVLVVIVNLLADLSYMLIDRRVMKG